MTRRGSRNGSQEGAGAVTLEQTDAALAEWQGKLNLASANLLELDDLFTYKRLRGTAGDALVGVTRDRVLPALAAMDQLWQSLALLTDTIGRAQALRKSASRLWATERSAREIEEILTGPSVLMPAAPAPLAQRELLSTSRQHPLPHPIASPLDHDGGV